MIIRKEASQHDDEDLVVVIKAGDESTYKNVVDILDEMTINDIKRYALVDISEVEGKFGKSYQNAECRSGHTMFRHRRNYLVLILLLKQYDKWKQIKFLHADILDIIFEGRNKEYGAYELRKTYNRTNYYQRLIWHYGYYMPFAFSFPSYWQIW